MGKPTVKYVFVAILMLLVARSETKGFKSLGCFKDTNDHDLPHEQIFAYHMTIEVCYAHCTKKSNKSGYKLFGLRKGGYCACGKREFPKYKRATNCDIMCTGNALQTCGGNSANNVYKIMRSQTRGLHSQVLPPSCAKLYTGWYHTDGMLKVYEGRNIKDLKNYDFDGKVKSYKVKHGFTLTFYKDTNFSGKKLVVFGNGDIRPYSGWIDKIKSVSCSARPKSAFKYIGCFRDESFPKRDFPLARMKMRRGMTTEWCYRHCSDQSMKRRIKFFATQDAMWCFCGVEAPKYEKIEKKECNSRCSGDNSQICGGNMRNSAYEIKIVPPVRTF